MGYKWSQEIVDQECMKLIDGLGYLPGGFTLMKTELNSLFMAIKRYGGGMNATRKRIGLSELSAKSNYRDMKSRSHNEIINTADSLYESKGHFPSIGWMQENGYAWLSNCIARQFGGTRKFQEMMGFEKTNMVKSSNNKLWDSKGESSVSNFFTDYNVVHERGHPYPDNSKRTFDFYLPDYDLHMELWGDFETTGPIPIKEEYDSRRSSKEQFHAESDLNILCIEYKDAINNKRLKEIFAEYL